MLPDLTVQQHPDGKCVHLLCLSFNRPVLKIEAETTPTRSIPIFIFGCERFAHGRLLHKCQNNG